MKRPPFKIDGRTGAMRWRDAHGAPQGATGRLTFLYAKVYADAIIAGTGESFEIRLGRGPWHPISATPAEVKRLIIAGPLPGHARQRIARLERVRARRVERGLPVIDSQYSQK